MLFSHHSKDINKKFEYFYKKYNALLYKYAYNILQNHSDVEDALQSAFYKIYCNLDKMSEEDERKAVNYMITIVVNTSKTLHTNLGKKSTINIDDLDYNDLVSIDLFYNCSDIQEALMKLTAEEKDLFMLKYVYGYSNAELAELFKISETNMAVKIHRSKNKLKKIILEEMKFDA